MQAQLVAPTTEQAASLSSFGERLFAQVLKAGDANPVISPLSVFYALGMADDGAGGDTAAAFQAVLGLSVEQTRQIAAYLLDQLATPGDGTTLTVANSAWLDENLTANQDWVDRLKSYYQADVYKQDLHSSATLKDVNQWISQKTNKLIPKMLDSIDPGVVALLVNALYMKALWQQPFNTDLTYKSEFTTAGGATVQADFMRQPYDTRQYIKTNTAEGIVLPYQDGRLEFLAVMPTNGQLTLDGSTIATLLAAAKTQDKVAFTMPKFQTEYGCDLVDALTALGLGAAFGSGADFSGIAPELFISDVVHKVSMAVGEKGTEAAAATVVMIATSGFAGDNLVDVVFDHPYLYAVVDKVTGIPLFVGQMDDPSQAPPAVE